MSSNLPSPEAEELFLAWLADHDEVDEGGLSTLCARHPGLDGELRGLFDEWRWLETDGQGEAADVHGARVEFSDERYKVLDRIARGGMGVVYDAWDTRFKRHLAMKVYVGGGDGSPSRPSSTSRSAFRFLEEAQVMGQLDHPGIVPVHDLGVDPDGRLFFTMRRIEGHDLKTLLEMVRARSEGWSVTRALEVIVRVCDTLAYAHEKSVLHRDVKPANVMVGRFGQTYVVDWGLARVRGKADSKADALREALGRASRELVTDRQDRAAEGHELSLLTAAGAVVGTPTYMAPEQGRGELEQVGARADVYSVGAILYHLLAGEPPYARESREAGGARAVLGALVAGPPRPLSHIAPGQPAELIAVCEKAMARELDDRYTTMEALAEDLRAFLEHRVVTAHRTGALIEMRKWVRRNRLEAGTIAAAAVLLVVSALAMAWIESTRSGELERTNTELTDAKARVEEEAELLRVSEGAEIAARKRAEIESYAGRIQAAHAALENHRPDLARKVLAGCAEEQRGWEWGYLESRLESHFERWTDAEVPMRGQTRCVVPLPEGRFATGHDGGRIRIWDGATGTVLRRLEQGEHVLSLAVTPDGSRLFSGDYKGTIKAWSVDTGEELFSARVHRRQVNGLAVDPGGRWVASTSNDETGAILSVRDLTLSARLRPETGFLMRASFSPDNAVLVTSGQDNALRFWSVPSGEPQGAVFIEAPEARTHFAWDVEYSHDGKWIACAGPSEKVTLLDARTRRVERVLSGHRTFVRAVAFSPDARRIATNSNDPMLRVWDVYTGEAVAVAHGASIVRETAFDDEGRRLAVALEDGGVGYWNLEGGVMVDALSAPELARSVSFSPDGRTLAVVAREFLTLWDRESGRLLRRLPSSPMWHNFVGWSPDGRFLASACTDGSTYLWDASTHDLVAVLPVSASKVRDVAFHPERGWLASAGYDGIVTLHDPQAARAGDESLVRRWELERGGGYCLAWAPGGQALVCGTGDGSLLVLDPLSGDIMHEVREHRGHVYGIAFDSRGEHFASTGADGSVVLWDPATWSVRRRLAGHAKRGLTVAFSPDGTRLASGSDDHSIVLWDVASGASILHLLQAKSWVHEVVFDPKRSSLFAAGGDLLLYDRTPKERRLREHAEAKERMRPYVEALVDEVWIPSQVRERIAADTMLSEPDRAAAVALGELAIYDAIQLKNAAWRVIRSADATPDELHRARLQALAAFEIHPWDASCARVVGAANVRVGRPDEARQLLVRSRELYRHRSSNAPVGVSGWEALVELASGHRAEARAGQQALMQQLAGSRWKENEELSFVVGELERGIAAGARGTTGQPEDNPTSRSGSVGEGHE